MNVLKKVLFAIGRFFRNIWRYIMTNAWIQPILIVALIFAAIFALTGIPSLIDEIKSWTDDTTDNKIKNQKTIDYDDFMKMYNNNETFFVVFGEEDCANCKTLYKTINTYMDDKEHKEIVNAKIYFFDVTDLLEDVEKDIEKYGELTFADEGEAFDKLKFITDLLYNGYADILSEYNGDDEYSASEPYGKYEDAYAIQSPTTVFFTKDANGTTSKMFNMVVGQWNYKQSYTDINRLFNSWHLSETDWAAAEKERDSLVLNYLG